MTMKCWTHCFPPPYCSLPYDSETAMPSNPHTASQELCVGDQGSRARTGSTENSFWTCEDTLRVVTPRQAKAPAHSQDQDFGADEIFLLKSVRLESINQQKKAVQKLTSSLPALTGKRNQNLVFIVKNIGQTFEFPRDYKEQKMYECKYFKAHLYMPVLF